MMLFNWWSKPGKNFCDGRCVYIMFLYLYSISILLTKFSINGDPYSWERQMVKRQTVILIRKRWNCFCRDEKVKMQQSYRLMVCNCNRIYGRTPLYIMIAWKLLPYVEMENKMAVIIRLLSFDVKQPFNSQKIWSIGFVLFSWRKSHFCFIYVFI